jgi:hypothetical protein
VFAVMDEVGKGIWRAFGRFVGPADEAAEPVAPPLAVHRLPAAAE